MFDSADGGEPELTGFFDFYFAGVDAWLFDIAVCLNDWCIDLPTGAMDLERTRAFLDAYTDVRPLQSQERDLLPALVRAGALRFWISRLWDLHLPREASMLQAHDPTHFERVLRQRVAHPLTTGQPARPSRMKLNLVPARHGLQFGCAWACALSFANPWPCRVCSSCFWRWPPSSA